MIANSIWRALLAGCSAALLAVPAVAPAQDLPKSGISTVLPRSNSTKVEIADIFYLRSASDPQISPDGRTILFTVQYSDRIGTPYSRIWVGDTASGRTAPWGGGEGIEGASPRWSPDGSRVAYRGVDGIMLASPAGAGARLLAPVDDTNHPLPRASNDFVWSPDGSKIAFVSAVPSTEPPMEADPIVITRYWYRPARGWPERFNDNKRLHLFYVDVASGKVTQLTDGDRYEHTIDWSPDGRSLLFLQNPEKDQDFTYNFDIYTVDIGNKAIERLSDTRDVEYATNFSPDGRTIAFSGLMRPVTSSETNMENPHVWTLDVATGSRRELGAAIDNVQGRPQWSPDGRWLYFTVQERGSVGLYRMPAVGGPAERVGPAADTQGSVRDFSVAQNGTVAASIATPDDLSQIYIFSPDGSATQLSTLNADLLRGKAIAETRAFTFKSYDGTEIEAFLTIPVGVNAQTPARSHPMIVNIHGGPHGQQGPNFTHKAQVYAAQGYAVLMVNYRGSTGYGQAFANMIARDQNGGEAMDVLRGVDAALAKYSWIDPERLGVEGASYGGQLTNWVITQTTRFKAAIPWASISNLVSHNYMSVYHDYLEQEYFGKPHTGGIMDMLWNRSAIRFVDRVETPVLLSHGDNDLLVNPAEIEQYYIALRDVGTRAVMLRYPREGHGMREVQHLADFTQRSIDWYEEHFAAQ